MSSIPVSVSHPDTIVVDEHSEIGPLILTDADYRMLDTIVNEDEDGAQRLRVRHTRNGDAYLKTTAYVGVVSFPDGPTLRIEPKTSADNLLRILRYAYGSDLSLLDSRESLHGEGWFVDAVAAVFLDELDDVLTKGLEKAYVRTDETERYLRGQLDAHRQLQRSPIAPTSFECSYEELTHDTPLNRVVLQASKQLAQLATDEQLKDDLFERSQRLESRVTNETVSPALADQIKLNRLNEHYESILEISKQVLRHSFVSDLARGRRASYSLLLNMNSVFEQLVERAAKAVARRRDGWSVEAQEGTDSLLQGEPTVEMYPDIVVRKDGQPLIVGDAKWKTSRQNSDLYQALSYQSAYDVPSILFYPGQRGSLETEYKVKGGKALALVELPTDFAAADIDEYVSEVESKLEEAIEECS